MTDSIAVGARNADLSFSPVACVQAGTARVLHLLLNAPVELFLLTLAVMLFRPPDLSFYDLDRIAFAVLVLFVGMRILARRDSLTFPRRVALPMLGLTILALTATASRPYEAQMWSVFAAKWLVPLVMFCLAGFVFDNPRALRKLEIFFWIVLLYLSLIAVLFLLDARAWIFPRYILNESIGIHADRARGPFLQAVANGVTLNLLALIALDSFRRRRLPVVLAVGFAILVPVAILATRTRAVWLSFGLSILVLLFLSSSKRVRVACACIAISSAVGLCAAMSNTDQNTSLMARLEEASPVEFREALYRAGWEMFKERPVLGWPGAKIQPEIERRISEFHQEAFYFHNTFLEIGVSYGVVGLALYLWIVVDLFRLSRAQYRIGLPCEKDQFLDKGFRALWPLLVCVYLLNACCVVMNYQFVNGFFFTVAGVLAAQERGARMRMEAVC